ncbi:MAG: hypothetical protein HW412_338 [Bacteroidetes bacterium]|nr:hypothetical protein [Bacteroidota bacterium]
MASSPSDKRTGLGWPHRIKVLRYHRIVDEKNPDCEHWSCIHVQQFRNQLELLERWGYTPITFEDYRLFLKGDLNLPRKPVVLTFDFACQDNYKYMFPAMQKFGAKGVIFAAGNRQIQEPGFQTTEGPLITDLMSDQALLEMHAAGFEIGSHGMTYSNLALVPAAQASEEVSRSRILLEILLNAPVLSFAYPFGKATKETKRLVTEAGYTIGCVMESGPRNFTSDLFEVRRIIMKKQTRPATFLAKLLL